MAPDQFIYTLKLRNDLLDENNWTEHDNSIIEEHFLRLKADVEKGKVILAGRTLNSDESQFGIVIFEAENLQIATKYMQKDPAIEKGIMRGEVYPYRVALIRKNY